MKRCIYFNTSFDRECAGTKCDELSSLFDEFTILGLFIADSNDFVLLDVLPDSEYLSFIQKAGFVSLYGTEPKKFPDYHVYPWGWNRQSFLRLHSSDCICRHPDLNVVKKVNSRLFSSQIAEKNHFPEPGICIQPGNDLFAHIEKTDWEKWMYKPIHGSSGNGFIRLRKKYINVNRGQIMLKIREAGTGVLEREFDRVSDFSANFTVSDNGEIENYSIHQSHVSNAGTFRGITLVPENYFDKEIRDTMQRASRITADSLFPEGYFGPVGIDGFTYTDADQSVKINPMCEINARLTMGEVARNLKKIFDHTFSRFRLLNRLSIKTVSSLLHSDSSGTVFIAKPEYLLMKGKKHSPHFAVAFVSADTIEELDRLEREYGIVPGNSKG